MIKQGRTALLTFCPIVLMQCCKSEATQFCQGWLLLLLTSRWTRYIMRLVYTKDGGDVLGNNEYLGDAYCPIGHYRQFIPGKTRAGDFFR